MGFSTVEPNVVHLGTFPDASATRSGVVKEQLVEFGAGLANEVSFMVSRDECKMKGTHDVPRVIVMTHGHKIGV